METHTSPWRSRRVLVTGCTGFLGSAVTRELFARGAIVVGLVRDRSRGGEFARELHAGQFRAVPGRVEDAVRLHTAMAVYEVSAIFHLATADPFGSDRGTDAVLAAAGLYHSKVPVVVARPAQQLRLAVEEHCSPMRLGIARFGEVFGPGDRSAERVVPRTITGHLAGSPAMTADDAPRDFVFVRDAARVCLEVAETVGTTQEPLDATFRSGWEFTSRAMAGLVAEVVAGRRPTRQANEPDSPLGWRRATTLDEALRETVAWFRESARANPDTALQGRKAA
jgi:nucleoside-diphosphate-sugar epimerase